MKAAWIAGLSPGNQNKMSAADSAKSTLTMHVQRLFASGPNIYLLCILSTCILITMLWSAIERPILLLWLNAIISISLLRWGLAQHYAAAFPARSQAADWHRNFLIGVTCASIAWGSTAVFLFPTESTTYQVFLIFVLAGITTAAVPTLAARRVAFLCFALSALSPIITRFLSGPDALSLTMAALSLLFLFALIKSVQLAAMENQESASIRHQNAELQAKLAAVEHTLNGEVRCQQELLDALQASELRFSDFAETATEWFWEMDEQLRFSYLSERFVGATGIPLDAILGHTCDEILQAHTTATSDTLQHHRAVLADRQAFKEMEFHLSDQYNKPIVINISGKPMFDQFGRWLGYRGTGRNITHTYQARQQLNFHTNHDAMTGLANRNYLDIRLQQALEKAKTLQTEHALCFIALDRFKIINDSYGHNAGNALLCQLGSLLSRCTRKHDVVARLGGDEFALLLMDCDLERATRIARALCHKVEAFQCHWQEHTFSTNMSVGIAAITQFTDTAQTILNDAESACYTAKKLGRNEVHIVIPSEAEKVQRQAEIALLSLLEEALVKNQFRLYYQSIKPLVSDDPAAEPHIEILLRLDDKNGKPISPGVFLPIAEKYGIAPQIDRWVINAALSWLQTVVAKRPSNAIQPIIAINLSGQSLSNLRLMHYIEERLAHYRVPPTLICFEITETAAIASLGYATQFIQGLRRLGCRFALDDFGSGFSSYAYLKNLDIDFIKIDGSFIKDIATNTLDRTMVQSIRDIGLALGKKTIAEHVEDQSILQILQDIGVDYIQGYHVDRPQPLGLQQASVSPMPKRVNLRAIS